MNKDEIEQQILRQKSPTDLERELAAWKANAKWLAEDVKDLRRQLGNETTVGLAALTIHEGLLKKEKS